MMGNPIGEDPVSNARQLAEIEPKARGSETEERQLPDFQVYERGYLC